MVTQFHTFSHFVALSTTVFEFPPGLQTSTSIQGVSKSHLLSVFSTYTHVYAHVTSHCSGAYAYDAIYYMVLAATSAITMIITVSNTAVSRALLLSIQYISKTPVFMAVLAQ